MRLTRRAFVGVLATVTESVLSAARASVQTSARLRHPPDRSDLAAIGARLRERFPDLLRRFVFEYYPWYGTDPWRHWNEAGRVPPVDIAATAVPALGAYDSGSVRVIEQHAKWIREAGVGAINISWWGPNKTTSTIMDVMRDHDLKVTFHLEPYSPSRGERYADDIRYLLREHGEKRHWDALLLLRDERGREMPVFKSFGTIRPPTSVDCLGRRHRERLYVSDSLWRRQTDSVREIVRHDFDRILLLCDSTNAGRVEASGFDGIVPFSNHMPMQQRAEIAKSCTSRGLLFSFNVNPGFDGVRLREPPSDPCYRPPGFDPPVARPIDWSDRADRARAERLSMSRIRRSLMTSVDLQTRPELTNDRRGFLLVYVNSFNEWHEGHSFEPAKDYDELTAVERHLGYHNPNNGRHRLEYLKRLLGEILQEA